MSEQIEYWALIIEEYKSSGLTHPAFCKQNGLSLNQFQYRWSQHLLAKRAKTKSYTPENNAVENSFEPVTITPLLSAPKEQVSNITEITIYLPNRIRCDVKMDLRKEAFTTLLKQLVVLC